jgi:hypothetical protein
MNQFWNARSGWKAIRQTLRNEIILDDWELAPE